ncbi:MAG: alkaline phosphatase family protein [Gemmatimonadota bacterium]|nr:alkaline phosphatase family protein [Gemmatimonadota bacterium]
MRSFLRQAFVLASLSVPLAVTACGSSDDGGATASQAALSATPPSAIKTVFVIMMENHSWATIKDAGDSASYINRTLVPMGAHAEQYSTPPGVHPSEPNYIWLEAGDSLGISSDDPPSANHRATKDHLTAQLEAKNIPWKAYAEDAPGDRCPLTSSGSFDPKHTPQLFFDDVTDKNDPHSQHCKDHVRPYSEFAHDLTANTVARYNFITPNLCNDMHGEVSFSCPFIVDDLVESGDNWLKAEIPKILDSAAYKDNGVIFLLWDEGDESLFSDAADGPIGMIAISPLAKKNYASQTKFTHSSMFRTLQTIFQVPLLNGAKTSNDLSEMFTSF